MDTLASRILQIRTRLGLTQGELAKRADVSQGTIGNLEAGIRQGGGSLPAIALALGVSYWWLRDGTGEQRPGIMAPDAATIALAFGALPMDTPDTLGRREWLYASLMAQIEKHADLPASTPAPAPAVPPTPAHVRALKKPL